MFSFILCVYILAIYARVSTSCFFSHAFYVSLSLLYSLQSPFLLLILAFYSLAIYIRVSTSLLSMSRPVSLPSFFILYSLLQNPLFLHGESLPFSSQSLPVSSSLFLADWSRLLFSRRVYALQDGVDFIVSRRVSSCFLVFFLHDESLPFSS